MDQTTLAGRILTPVGWVTGTIRCTAQVLAIEPGPAPEDQFIVPGFVDLHVHGGHGADCMEGADAVRRMARFHAGHGTTALLATTVTAPADDLRLRHGRDRRRHARAGAGRAHPGRPPRGAVHQPGRTGCPAAIRDPARPGSAGGVGGHGPDPGGHLRAGDRPVGRAVGSVPVPGHTRPDRPHHLRLRPGPCGAGRGGLGLHPPLQRHVRPAPSPLGCRRRCPGAGTLGRADPRLPACRRGCGTHGTTLCAAPALRHRRRRRGRHARWRIPSGHAHDHEARRHGPPGRRQPCRQRADHGPGAAQPLGAGPAAGGSSALLQHAAGRVSRPGGPRAIGAGFGGRHRGARIRRALSRRCCWKVGAWAHREAAWRR